MAVAWRVGFFREREGVLLTVFIKGIEIIFVVFLVFGFVFYVFFIVFDSYVGSWWLVFL